MIHSLTACLLIVFYVVDELSYDRYNVKADRIYRINTDIKFGGKASSSAAAEPPLAEAIKSNFPEVEKTLRLRPAAYSFSGRFYVRKGNENIREKDLIFTESALFNLFTLPMVEGNPSTALNDPHTAVITESAAKKYFNRTNVGQIFMVFSTLAVLIACLGLFGLAAYAGEQRTKEIGIRKVLGANVSVIVRMLSMDFIKLVLIALLISAPIAWWTMQKWLQDFAYRVDMHWWILGIAGSMALLIAFITISFQSIKAAIANPVESLRAE